MLAREFARPAAKAAGSFDRTVPLAATLALLPELCARFGITRLADLTYLDRAAVPVFSAIVPRSPDLISTYNGKGLTADHARASAVMEAVERQCAARASLLPLVRAKWEPDVVEPECLGLPAEVDGAPHAFVAGYDVLRARETAVPLASAICPWPRRTGAPPTSTNGLASGNTLLEAFYHALCELVERHIFSVADARGRLRPYRFLANLCGGQGDWVDRLVDDPVGRALATPTGDRALDAYLERVQTAGLTPRLIVVEETDLPLLIVASVCEPGAGGRTHMGLGCSWSPLHAATRALTEAMQSRLADISATREDIVGDGDMPDEPYAYARRCSRPPKGRWYFDATRSFVTLGSLPDRSSDDLARDACALLDALQRAGARRIVAVDLTPLPCPVRVVRVVAPDLETMFIDGRIGPTIEALLATVPDRPFSKL